MPQKRYEVLTGGGKKLPVTCPERHLLLVYYYFQYHHHIRLLKQKWQNASAIQVNMREKCKKCTVLNSESCRNTWPNHLFRLVLSISTSTLSVPTASNTSSFEHLIRPSWSMIFSSCDAKSIFHFQMLPTVEQWWIEIWRTVTAYTVRGLCK